MKENELIFLYCYLCDRNDSLLMPYSQRFSLNLKPSNEKLTDVELLTIYFYCRRFENKHRKIEIYDYAKRYLMSWFPDLPTYANFTHRLNRLTDALPFLVQHLVTEVQLAESQHIMKDISLVDSLPIMLCSGKRKGKVASEISKKSFCATKGVYYYGLKLHAIAFKRKEQLPIPEYLLVTSGDENDLEVLRHVFPQLTDRAIICDKAYVDKQLNPILNLCDSHLYTPVKLVKGDSIEDRQRKKAADDLFSTAVSTLRQPIESLFNWLIEKTGIQRASTVRSTSGLMLHTFGALATAMLFWLI